MPVEPAIAAQIAQIGALPPLRLDDFARVEELRKQSWARVPAVEPIEVGAVEDGVLPGPAGEIPVRVYRPGGTSGPVPTVVFFHGGGWVAGDLDSHDQITRRLCRDVRAVVVAVHYRRAPEHPYPAPLDDCLAAARHVAGHPGAYGGGRLAVAGDSAGANLAAVTALVFRDEQRPLDAQLLAYPPTDGVGDHPSRTGNGEGYLLTTDAMSELERAYTGGDPGTLRSWRISPLRAPDFTGVAPAVVGTAQYDPLRDEGRAYAKALADAGADVFHRTYDGLVHGFLSLFDHSAASDAATAELFAELAARLA
ncbi:alpha/beta hydrolase [Streptomyces sp. AV19]|uniref:alpha/beta hydrolase n=1 Tax=Streptomyces sp. AV19 TaxID=2793068 RepID=UPI0018FECC36|nr:alpha/beta hydrolase [Streptomyces sp. AV19]MBH1933750.1 alpha/beta hydrolase [Streptomyces sp. AV19]MDG4535745.1 alpha/beta hydrolase [Streptomyces sp. AV19]